MKKYFALIILLISINFTYGQQTISKCKKTCIIENVFYKDAFLGIRIRTVKKNKGAKILQIFKNTAAEKSVLQLNDIITSVNGVEIANNMQLTRMIQGMQPFDKVKVVYEREGKIKKISTLLGAKKILIEKNEICCDLIDKNINVDQIILFPNPATSDLNLTFKDASSGELFSFEIYSMEGVKQISKKNQELNGRTSNKIEVDALANGSYVIRVVKGNKAYSKQFTVFN